MSKLATRGSQTCAAVTLKRTELAPSAARSFVRDVLSDQDVAEDVIWAACLVTSELITNVVSHVRAAEEMRLCVSMKEGRPLVEVWDPSSVHPAPVEESTGTSGRGLTDVVANLSTVWWSTFPNDPGGGKIVSAWIYDEQRLQKAGTEE